MKTVLRTFGRILRNLIIFLIIIALLALAVCYAAVVQGTKNYPLSYSAEIQEAAKSAGLDPYLVAGIVKTESDFRSDAVSKVGASGLMQILPDAKVEAAQKLGLDPESVDLMDPLQNLKIGTQYFSDLLQKYQSRDLAIVAYNAGKKNVDQWLADGTISWEIDSMKNIPNKEPREYVQKVNKAKSIYEVFYFDGLPGTDSKRNTYAQAFHNMLNVFRWAWATYIK